MSENDDFEIVDGLAEERERYGVGFGDNVRIRATPETERLGYAGLTGNVYGETAPSEGLAEGIVGEPGSDYAVNVWLDALEDQFWFAPQLVEFVDHDPGGTFQLEGGPEYVRDERGEWHEVRRPGFLRRFFRRS